ncbi:MAG: hypothetical protein QOJ82_2504 [Solirubrobacteraceae bacterium]|jgi:cytochrome P450|nr:hypothetical protein [Solirubrobacteraceae bacterium]
MASARSAFGADGEAHRAARARLEGVFAPAAVERRQRAMVDLAAAHAER